MPQMYIVVDMIITTNQVVLESFYSVWFYLFLPHRKHVLIYLSVLDVL